MNWIKWLFGNRSLIAKVFGYYKHDPAPTPPPPAPAPTPAPVPPPPLVIPLPPVPSRDEKITARLHFGGLRFNHSSLGTIPLFEACFCWLGEVDRAEVYRVKHEAGDRHLLVEVPSGVPLYDEPDQPYNPANFPAKGYDAGEFKGLVKEAIMNGFIPILFMNEDHDLSLAAVQQVLRDLMAGEDLVPYCIFSPGWDGIFYGWEPSHVIIPAWAAAARAIYPDVTLFLEHDPGHIPLGEGGGDYQPGGLMEGFDIIAGEFPTTPDDTVWQIIKRMGCGPDGYHRPADQPAGDDPGAGPQYLPANSPRGPFAYWVFETGVYEDVRSRITPEEMEAKRGYYRALGAGNVC